MAKKITLADWIREVTSDPYKEAQVSAIALLHMQGGATPKELYTFKYGGRDASPEELGAMFEHKARTHVQDIPGVQTFNLVAFYGLESTPGVEHPFIVNGENQFEGLATEPPNERGTLQQGMRLTEVIVQRVIGQISVVMNHTENIIARSDRRLEHVEEENRELFSLMKDMLMEKSNLSHEKRMAEMEYERKTKEREKLYQAAPALLNTIAGRNIFPQATQDTALIEGLADAVGEEQITQIAALLPPEVVAPLMARMTAHFEKKRKDQESVALAMPKGVENELDS